VSARSERRPCCVCGKVFIVYPGDPDHRCCSQACYHKSGRCTGRTKTHLGYTCKGCGKYIKLGIGEKPSVYCSDECLGRWQKTRKLSSETREKIATRAKKRWATDAYRSKAMETIYRPDVRERRLLATRLALRRPEVRAQRSVNGAKRAASLRPSNGWQIYSRPDGTKVNMRSAWERSFASRLDQLGLTWEYEPRSFVLSDGRGYLPDFLVETPFGTCFVEVHAMKKPWVGGAAKIEKIALASKELPFPLVIVDEDGIRDVRRALNVHLSERKAA
jgi:hypothetical protein